MEKKSSYTLIILICLSANIILLTCVVLICLVLIVNLVVCGPLPRPYPTVADVCADEHASTHGHADRDGTPRAVR